MMRRIRQACCSKRGVCCPPCGRRAVRSMDESRAGELLRAERTGVAMLLRQTEEAVRIDDEVPDSATDFGDEGLPLTEEAEDEAVAVQLRNRLNEIDLALARLEAFT